MPQKYYVSKFGDFSNASLIRNFNSTLLFVIGPYFYLLLTIDNLRFSSRRSYTEFEYIIFICIDYTLYLCYNKYTKKRGVF